MTNLRLRSLYAWHNKHHFGGKLPMLGIRVHWKQPKARSTAAEYVAYTDGTREIRIAPLLKKLRADCFVHSSLLHEMCHLSLEVKGHSKRVSCGHGRAFQNEMKRLAEAGAFRNVW